MAPIRLYLVRLSPTCRIVWLYLLQNDIEHELIDINDMEDIKVGVADDDLDGHTQVPIITDGKVIVSEAPAILAYLAKTYAKHEGCGHTLREQAKCASLISWVNSDLHRIIGYMYIYPQFFDKFRLETESANECLIESGIQLLTRQLSKIDTLHLASSNYVCGSQITLADSFVVTTLLQVQWAGFKFNIWPKVRAWIDRVSQQPYWSQVHETHEHFLEEVRKESELI